MIPVILGGKRRGLIDEENGIYLTDRSVETMFHKFGDGFGLSIKIIDFLVDKKVDFVVVNFENRKSFWVNLGLFNLYGEEYSDGQDEQKILPLKYWLEDWEK